MNHLPLRAAGEGIEIPESVNCGCAGGSPTSWSGAGGFVGIRVKGSDGTVDGFKVDRVSETFS